MIVITLPCLPPTVNHYYIQRGSRKFLSKVANQFRQTVADNFGNQPMLDGRIKMTVQLMASNKRRWDLDNRIKPLQDALQLAGCFENDSQIDHLTVMRVLSTGVDATKIILERLSDA